MKIRQATNKDVDQMYLVLLDMIRAEDKAFRQTNHYLMRLRKKISNFEASSKKELRREIKAKHSKYLVAVIDDKIVAYARGEIKDGKNAFFEAKKTGYLHSLAVLQKYRGQGIASQLYQALEKWFKQKKCIQINLHVLQNNPAQKIYKKWGYISYIEALSKKL